MNDTSNPGGREWGRDGFYRDHIRPSRETSEFELIEIISELETKESDELPPLYDEVGHLIEMLYNNPPSQQAQVEMSFSYAGYRITIDQRGNLKLIPVKDSMKE
ncbi:HalOD1 output domain-containing protein [Halorientalis halophila]|uniref:HalOD1 output domain-containing protein n=1 Tax=Halorientalis halophila TaxID=3108499 RepID=UPI00300BAD81